MLLMKMYTRFRGVVRFRPHDTTTEHGRSHERYRRMVLTSASAFGSRAIGLLASLISVPLTFRYLGAERYGLWMVLTSIISIMGFADLGIGNGVVNSVSEAYGKGDRDLAKEYVTSASVLLLCIAAVLALAGLVAYPFIPWLRVFNVKSETVATEGAKAFLVLYFWFVANIPLGVVTRAQAGLQQAYWSQVIGAGGNILSLLALVFVIATHANLAVLVFASTFGSIIAILTNGWLLFREHPWLLPTWHSFRAQSANKIFKLGLMFFVLQSAVAVGFTSDNVVITQILGAAAVAVYAVPQKLFGVVSMLVSLGISPIWPAYGEALARGDVTWVRRAFWSSLRAIVLLAVPVCAILVFAGPWILRVTMGKSLHVPMSVLVVLGIWGVVSTASMPVSLLLNGVGAMKAQAIIAVVASSSNLALSIFLTRRLGVIGVCLGSSITQVLIVFPAYFFILRNLFIDLAGANTEKSSESNIPRHLIG